MKQNAVLIDEKLVAIVTKWVESNREEINNAVKKASESADEVSRQTKNIKWEEIDRPMDI